MEPEGTAVSVCERLCVNLGIVSVDAVCVWAGLGEELDT